MRTAALRPLCRPTSSLVMLAGLLAGCAGRDSDGAAVETSQYGGTVVIANNSDLENLNSLVASDRFTQEFNRFALFLPLVHYGPDLEYEPALAEHWELLGDTGVVFHLRRDVTWHDGRPTTARDVLFTFERAKDPETGFPNAEYFQLWTGGEVVDDHTVRFSFDPHVEALAGLPFLPIMPAHMLDSIPPARMRQAAFNRRPVGNGPFRFVEYRANDRWVFEANPDFAPSLGGRPYIDRLVWRPVPDGVAQITALTTGQADVLLSPLSSEFDRVARQPGVSGIIRPGRQYANVMWNHRVPPLGDPRVRRALSMAVNRRQIIDALREGHGDLAVGPIGPYHWAFDESLEPLPHDPAAARELLREAGFVDADGDGTLDLQDGRPFTIELKVPAGSQINRDMAELIRSDLAVVGVRVVARPVEFSVMIQDLTRAERNFQAAILAWESDFKVNLRDTFHSGALGGMYQIASYSNARVDSLIDAAALTHDRDAARSIYGELQRIMRDEQPWSFLYYYPDLVLVRDRVQNVRMDIRGALLNVREWWVTDPRPTQAGMGFGDSADRSPDPAPAQSQ